MTTSSNSIPDISPTVFPSYEPSRKPSNEPSYNPSTKPSNVPSDSPSVVASTRPSLDPFSWDLELVTPGYLKDPPIEDGVQEFITSFNMSDRDYVIQVLKPDCLTSSTGLSLINTTHISNSLEATFMYNQSVIQSSNLWTSNSTGGDVDFCVKLSMYSNSSNGILFNFIETIYRIQVDLTTGFSNLCMN